MGFTTGFTGGVTLTLGAAYLTVLAHQRNREAQCQSLRSQAHVLNSLVEPVVQPPPPTRSELAAAARANLAETAKDRWNLEVENAVRWMQRTDWDEVRERTEDTVAKLWVKAFSGAEELEAKAERDVVPVVKDAAREAKAKGTAAASEGEESVAASAKTAWQRAKDKTQAAAALAEAKAAEAKSVAAAAVDRGVETGQVLAGKVKTAVGLAEDKLQVKADGKILPAMSPVEKALHQRFEKPAGLNGTVKEALKERYTPMDQRDNTVLRGL